jgi:hypothetical protein
MNEHTIGNLLPVVIMLFFVISAMMKRMARGSKPAEPPAPATPPPRRRLAPPQAVRPVMPPVLPAPARVAMVPSMAETLPAEAAAAFPALDLSLPDTPGIPSPARRRRVRTLGGGPAIGSPGWAANAILANEILGPPVALRSGATVGVPHAF